MKFLIDNQLPIGLVSFFKSHGVEASQVIHHQLDEATDQEIWSFATRNQWTIITKDEDFFTLQP